MLICFEGTRDSNLPLLGKNDICQAPSANGRACKLRSSKATTRLLTACRTETPSSPTRNIIIEEKHHQNRNIITPNHHFIACFVLLHINSHKLFPKTCFPTSPHRYCWPAPAYCLFPESRPTTRKIQDCWQIPRFPGMM